MSRALLLPSLVATLTVARFSLVLADGDPAAPAPAPAAPPLTAATIPTVDEAQLIAAIQGSDPRIERLEAEVDTARAEVVTAGLRAEPSLAFDREEVFADAGSVPTSYVRIVLPLDISGRRARRIAAADLGVAAARADARQSTFAYVVDGLRVFHAAAYARLVMEVLDGERGALVRAVEIVRKRSSAGDASGYDLARFELELAAYDDLRASAAIDLDTSRRQLATLMGRDTPVDAAGALPLPSVPELDVLLDGAVDSRADYRAATLRGDAARADEAVAARTWVPGLSLTAGVMSADLGTETAYGYVAGLSLSFPIFDRGQAAKARARAALRAATADVHTLERVVPAAVRSAHATLVSRVEQATTLATAQLARLEPLLRAAETGYREGDAGVVELLEAYRTARDARLRDLALRRDATSARLDLTLALGHLP